MARSWWALAVIFVLVGCEASPPPPRRRRIEDGRWGPTWVSELDEHAREMDARLREEAVTTPKDAESPADPIVIKGRADDTPSSSELARRRRQAINDQLEAARDASRAREDAERHEREELAAQEAAQRKADKAKEDARAAQELSENALERARRKS